MNEIANIIGITDWVRESEKSPRSNNQLVKAGIDSRRCLDCNKMITADQVSPFCSNVCMTAWDKGGQERYRQIENDKKDPKILLQQYSQVMEWAQEHSH